MEMKRLAEVLCSGSDSAAPPEACCSAWWGALPTGYSTAGTNECSILGHRTEM